MPISIYEAVTAGDCAERDAPKAHAAWMAAHFSAAGTGVSNLPQHLPPGSLLILDDQIPWQNHDAQRICQELLQAVADLACSGILLDFEREPCPQTRSFCALLCTYCQQHSIPLGMPPAYGLSLPVALFLPPLPCWPGPKTVLQPFSGRELWMDAAESGCVAEIGSESVQIFPANPLSCRRRRKDMLSSGMAGYAVGTTAGRWASESGLPCMTPGRRWSRSWISAPSWA